MKNSQEALMRAWIVKIAVLLLVVLPALSACDLTNGSVDRATQQAVGVLDSAINALANQSADWRSVLQDAQAKLTDSAQSTIRNEISNTLQRAEQAATSN